MATWILPVTETNSGVLEFDTKEDAERFKESPEELHYMNWSHSKVEFGEITEGAKDDGDVLKAIAEVLWPPEDPDASWNADTIAAVAELLQEHRPELLPQE